MRLPRAFVLYPTYQTARSVRQRLEHVQRARQLRQRDNAASNQVARNTLAIPETQALTDVTVEAAVTDVNRDPRTVDLMVRAGGVEQTITLTRPERLADLAQVLR